MNIDIAYKIAEFIIEKPKKLLHWFPIDKINWDCLQYNPNIFEDDIDLWKIKVGNFANIIMEAYSYKE